MTTIQHIAFNCRDRLAMERFYTEQFGFRRVRVFNPGAANEFVMLRLGSVCLEFFGARDASPAVQGGGEQAIGFKHLAFEVPDLDAAIERLKSAGMAPGNPIDASKHVPGLRICFFNDPEGNTIELMDGWQDDPSL